jgi:hypothetical protein
MAYYRLVHTDTREPYYVDGMCGVYSGKADIAETVDDRDDLMDADGFPLPGWIWFPGPARK